MHNMLSVVITRSQEFGYLCSLYTAPFLLEQKQFKKNKSKDAGNLSFNSKVITIEIFYSRKRGKGNVHLTAFYFYFFFFVYFSIGP